MLVGMDFTRKHYEDNDDSKCPALYLLGARSAQNFLATGLRMSVR